MKSLLLVLFVLSTAAFAQERVCDFPVPAYKIDEFAFTGISKSAYNRVNQKIKDTYSTIFAQAGCPLVVHDSWSEGEVNAQAWKENGECHVEIFGGLARAGYMTENATLQVGLHEVGHHLGGRPFYSGSTMSCEGQADIFSTADGMPRAGRASKASSLALAKTLATLAGDPLPKRPVPALPPVSRTYCGHPEAACRLLTYDAGRIGLERPRCWYK